MDIAVKYSPEGIERKWYKYWMENELFASYPDERPPYTITMPPPNVTGVLHMGHMLNNTIQDILVRRARMTGYNACWVPGTDHASIATEAKVVARLASEGLDKTDIGREDFLKRAWGWTEEHGGIILEQLKRLGASCDWNRTAFTLDDERSKSVIEAFVRLHDKGLIYRGVRIINWDPKAQTTIGDEEVVFKESVGKLFYLRYEVVEEPGRFIIVATTRPETIMGDTAVCINPTDERYSWLRGKHVRVPIVGREVPIIEDEYVDIAFGTGCLKVTPAHDVNDFELGQKHQLKTIDIFNNDGSLNEHGGTYAGQDRFTVRDQIVRDLEAEELLEKTEEYTNKVGYSERTNVPIEPKLSMQWFLSMKELAKPALEAVMTGQIQLHPAKYINTYKHWMENIKDWSISRQLWWGHRIPAYYLPDGQIVVAATQEEALERANELSGSNQLTLDDLRHDEDCLDTWFSSWLWPITVFGSLQNADSKDLNYYYPTSDLVTAPDIIFFWVARMIMAGYEFRGEKPFDNVYFTGIVRDAEGKKMSKSLGNSPDPIELMERYGADGVRMGMMISAPAGNDLLFDESLCEQGRNFCNKIWNSFRLIQMWQPSEQEVQPIASALAIRWMRSRINAVKDELNDLFQKYRLSEAMTLLYKLIRDDFSGWFLEVVKPAYGSPIDKVTLSETLFFFGELLELLHPFMPFITEELWQHLEERKANDSIMTQQISSTDSHIDTKLLAEMDYIRHVVAGIRSIRLSRNIPNKEKLSLEALAEHDSSLDALVIKMGNLEKIELVAELSASAPNFVVGTLRYAVPIADMIDVEAELEKLHADLNYQRGFLQSIEKKLDNKKFAQNAPEAVIKMEQKKKSDTLLRIQSLEESIKGLKK